MKKLILLGSMILVGCSSSPYTDEHIREGASKFVKANICYNKLTNKKETSFRIEYQKFIQVFNNFIGYNFNPDEKQKMSTLIPQYEQYYVNMGMITKTWCINQIPEFMRDRMTANNTLISSHQYHLVVQ